MGLADRLKAKYLIRFDELIAAGDAMPMEKHSQRTSYNYLSGESSYRHFDLARLPDFVEWRTSCIAVLDQVVPSTSMLRSTVESFHTLDNKPKNVQVAVGFLRSVRKEVETGFLDSLVRQIEAEILSDHLDQATATLAGSKDEPGHIAAAVIAGSALERCLHMICSSLEPTEPLSSDNGRALGMSALIDALKKRQVFNELQAKELRTWTALRNDAAHGRFQAFSRRQVEDMVAGVTRFLLEHSK